MLVHGLGMAVSHAMPGRPMASHTAARCGYCLQQYATAFFEIVSHKYKEK